jgi:xylulokinase
LQADIYGGPVVTINASEGPAYGVALLAGVGTGVWASVEEACEATIRVEEETTTDPERAALYNKYYPIYGQLYQRLKDEFDKITEIVRGK